ncbi:MAG: hypothetical protein ACKVS9_06555 [Phycisphaerae bacterium]
MQGKQYSPIPKLRLHKASGKAAVMLDGKYHYLGAYGSDEAQQRYDRMIAEWLANRRTTTGTEAARLQLDKAERATVIAAQFVDDAVGALREQHADYEVAVRRYEVEIAEWRKKQRHGQGGESRCCGFHAARSAASQRSRIITYHLERYSSRDVKR